MQFRGIFVITEHIFQQIKPCVNSIFVTSHKNVYIICIFTILKNAL